MIQRSLVGRRTNIVYKTALHSDFESDVDVMAEIASCIRLVFRNSPHDNLEVQHCNCIVPGLRQKGKPFRTCKLIHRTTIARSHQAPRFPPLCRQDYKTHRQDLQGYGKQERTTDSGFEICDQRTTVPASQATKLPTTKAQC